MRKEKKYARAKFPVKVIKEALRQLPMGLKSNKITESIEALTIEKSDEKWSYDSEDEFFADYLKELELARYWKKVNSRHLEIWCFRSLTTVSVIAESRAAIESVFSVFETHLPESTLPEELQEKPSIFIGHGHDPAWRDLKDHLHEKHSYPVTAYEIGARAGYLVQEVLNEMLVESSFAILVMTGEDEMADGTLRARDNVIHETGLFQGKLGFKRAIVLLEEGTTEFSNIIGVQQIRFTKGNINGTFGEVLATIRREFP